MQIGSDFGAGISKLGIRLNEMSDFLMRSICDVLCCGEYDTAARVLEKMGWIVDEAVWNRSKACALDTKEYRTRPADVQRSGKDQMPGQQKKKFFRRKEDRRCASPLLACGKGG